MTGKGLFREGLAISTSSLKSDFMLKVGEGMLFGINILTSKLGLSE